MSSREYRKSITHENNCKSPFFLKQSLPRRLFCKILIQGSALISSLSSCTKSLNLNQSTKNNDLNITQTLESLHQHLFPKDENGPDSTQINATGYLIRIMHSTKTSGYKKKTISSGVIALNEISENLFSTSFANLSEAQKEQSLREFEKTELGERFLSNIMDLIFEALLADPVYSAQPEFVGWRWLEHIPGFPRPEKPNSKVI